MPRDNPSAAQAVRVLGDDLLGVAVSDTAAGQQVAAELREGGIWLDVVAGIDSVAVHIDLVALDVDTASDRLAAQLATVAAVSEQPAELIEIPVCYGGEYGPDFAALCASHNLSPEQLIELHTAREYTVDMLGFTPGFAYIGGLPEQLDVPRLEQPRQRVAAGSIGIADGRSGIYALAGPGGWPLIGRTPERLFAADAEQPFVLRAGTRVRFKSIEARQFRALDES